MAAIAAAAAAAAAAYAGLRGGGGVGGDDRGSIYRNGDLYIARRGLCIASTHPAQSHSLFPADRQPPTSRAHRSALRTFASGIVGARGCCGVAGATVRHGGVVRGAGRFNETRPHHPLPAGRARLLVRRNASPIQLPVLKVRPCARDRRMRCGTR